MKILNKYILSSFALLAAMTTVNAQNTRSGYFVDDYTYRFQMNPAFDNSRSFFSMPGLGNVNVSMAGTLAVSDVLYNVDGRTTTFLNPGVSVDEVMSNIGNSNRIGADLNLTLISTGFKALGGYNTIAIGARSSVGVRVPRSLFSLLKEGVANETYDISDLGARATAYAEIALGHSHQLGKKWRVGGTFKFLVGGGFVDADLHNSQLNLGREEWTITANGDVSANVKGLSYKTKVNDRTGHRYVNGAEINGAGINGFGAALDLGAVFTPTKSWSLSLALLDFGFIRWSNNVLASTCGEKTFNTDRYTFNVDDDASNSFSKEWDRMRDDLTGLYELDNMGDTGAKTRMLGATLNTGVQFTLPGYDKLNFGLLNTTRIQGAYSWTDFRLSANIAPVKCLSGSVNVSEGTFGFGFGWLINLHTKGFNLFLGMDRTLGKLTKEGIPLNSNASVNFGMNFPL